MNRIKTKCSVIGPQHGCCKAPVVQPELPAGAKAGVGQCKRDDSISSLYHIYPPQFWKEPWHGSNQSQQESDLTLVGMHVGLEWENFSVATACSSVQVQSRQEFHVSYSCCVHLHEVLHPAGLLLRALQGQREKYRGMSKTLSLFPEYTCYARYNDENKLDVADI